MKRIEICEKQMSEIIDFSRLAYEKNLISAAGGNVSARYEDKILITATNASLRNITRESIVICDLNGEVLEAEGNHSPSKEMMLHLKVYKAKKDVKFIMHLHPCNSIAWSISNNQLPLYTQSAKQKLIHVPYIEDYCAGSMELANEVEKVVSASDDSIHAYIMKNHGVLVTGATGGACFETAELLEDTAKIAILHGILSN